jgi:hypothetical protein
LLGQPSLRHPQPLPQSRELELEQLFVRNARSIEALRATRALPRASHATGREEQSDQDAAETQHEDDRRSAAGAELERADLGLADEARSVPRQHMMEIVERQ